MAGAGDKKRYTEEQVKEAISHSDFTIKSIANYLARHYSKDNKCDSKTAERYIKKYHLEAELEGGEMDITSLAYGNIKRAIEKGDTKTSKWWLERIKREKFGNEIVVHNDNKEPLNINFENFSKEEFLADRTNSEIGGLDEEKPADTE